MKEYLFAPMSGAAELIISAIIVWALMCILGRLALLLDAFLVGIMIGDFIAAIICLRVIYLVAAAIYHGQTFYLWEIDRWQWMAMIFLTGNAIYMFALWKDASRPREKPK